MVKKKPNYKRRRRIAQNILDLCLLAGYMIVTRPAHGLEFFGYQLIWIGFVLDRSLNRK